MNPDERKAKNRLWRDLWKLAEDWEAHYPAPSAAACARQLKDILRPYKPNEPGRPPEVEDAMSDPKYITGADVLRALAKGKKVRIRGTAGEYLHQIGGALVNARGLPAYGRWDFAADEWEIVEEPATDAELVAEMRRLAETVITPVACAAYALCADMLEQRTLKPPKWKAAP